jgi:chemotaxis protein histidine kinase CheA
MNQIRKQVTHARRRLILGEFGRSLALAMFLGLILASVGLAIPKIWYLDILERPADLQRWNFAWLIGGAVLGLAIAIWATTRQIQSQLSVATEVDRRFKLRERLSSALSLSEQDLATPAGQALLHDAVRRAETIDVRDEFRFHPTAKALLPFIPLALMAILLFVPNATQQDVVASGNNGIDQKRMEMMIEEAKKKKEEKRSEETKGLKDASPEIQALEKKFDELLADKDTDKKSALVKLNDIKKQVEDRKRELGDSEALKENLNRLKDAAKGPAKELADALGKGDMPQAQKAIRELADKLREGKLNEMEAKKLAEDLEAMAKELNKLAEQKEQEKKQAEEQLKKALEKGDLDKAAQLQEKIERLEEQQKQNEKMQKMAEQLQKCANCMKEGGSAGKQQNNQDNPPEGGDSTQQAQSMKAAAEALDDIANELEKMQAEMEELEDLEALDKLSEDCKGCMNGGNKEGEPRWNDWGDGEGQAGGKRALEKNDTGGFKARVKGQVQQGETVVTGTADGDNITGRTSSEARKLVDEAMGRDNDPLENQVLPKALREHAQQYFESLRRND